jgi:hypothetical protein
VFRLSAHLCFAAHWPAHHGKIKTAREYDPLPLVARSSTGNHNKNAALENKQECLFFMCKRPLLTDNLDHDTLNLKSEPD